MTWYFLVLYGCFVLKLLNLAGTDFCSSSFMGKLQHFICCSLTTVQLLLVRFSLPLKVDNLHSYDHTKKFAISGCGAVFALYQDDSYCLSASQTHKLKCCIFCIQMHKKVFSPAFYVQTSSVPQRQRTWIQSTPFTDWHPHIETGAHSHMQHMDSRFFSDRLRQRRQCSQNLRVASPPRGPVHIPLPPASLICSAAFASPKEDPWLPLYFICSAAHTELYSLVAWIQSAVELIWQIC